MMQKTIKLLTWTLTPYPTTFLNIPVKIPGYKEKKISRSKFTKVTTKFLCTDAPDFYEGWYGAEIIHGGRAIQLILPTVPSFGSHIQ
jgi:hypothetical protein